MQKLPEIKAAYDWFVARYAEEIAERTRKNDFAGIEQMNVRRDILERGIFILMFGQFEKAVSAAFEEDRNVRAANSDWTRRRGWDSPSLKGNRVPFDTKLTMVLDSHSPSFGHIIKTYATRNHCAHGGTTEPVGSIDALEADLYQWHHDLRR